MTRKKPICFVAMAFDHADTDEIYDRHIKPVLDRNNVIPIIINRQEDNRDINNQIMQHLNSCDFCIADLTYARPSVYFEAGYAQRQVEVIYTARADHLGKGLSEDRRVHFDLQMKPIIKWDNPSDRTFQSRLEKRLRNTFLRTWKQGSEKIEKIAEEREKFTALPFLVRLKIYRKNGINVSIRHKFGKWVIAENPPFNYGSHAFFERVYKNPSRYSNYNVHFAGSNKTAKCLKIITITSIEKVTSRFLKFGWLSLPNFKVDHLAKNKRLLKSLIRIEEHHLILSPSSTPESRIRSELPNYHKDNERDRYFHDTKFDFKEDGNQISIDRRIFYYFPRGLDSESEVKNKLEKIIREIQ